MARFATAFNALVQRGFSASAELGTADTLLANAMDGYGPLDTALENAEAAVTQAEQAARALDARADAIEYPEFEQDHFVDVVDSARDVVDQTATVLTTDIDVLRQRIALARTGSAEPALVLALDAAWARNAGRQIVTENIMLEVAIASMQSDHPQHGLSRAYLASNNAVLPIVEMLNLPGGPLADDARAGAAALNRYADEMDAALADSRRALGRWRLRALLDANFRRLVPLYDTSLETEAAISEILRALSDLMSEAAQGVFDPEPFTALDARLQALIQRRASEAQARIAAISRITSDQ